MQKRIGLGNASRIKVALLAGLLALAGLESAPGTVIGTTNHVWHAVGSSSSFIRGTPAFGDDGTIYVGSGDNNLYAFNPDGTTNHVWATGGDIIGSPAIGSNGTIYVASTDNKLYEFNPDGTTGFSWMLSSSIYGTPAIGADGTIYIGDLGHKFYALNPADGTTSHVWSAGGDFRGHPAIAADGTVYVGNDDHNLYAFNPDGTTNHVWTMNGQIYHGPAISSNGTIYIGDQAGYFWAFNPDGTTGHVWKLSDMVYHSSAAIGPDGRIYVGAMSTVTTNAYCFSLNPNGTTNRVWQLDSSRYQMNSPVIGLDGTVFIAAGYTLFGLDPVTGATNVSWYLGDDTMSGAAIGPDKNIYIGCERGAFYSLAGILPMANTYWPKQHQNLKNTGLAFYPPRNVSASDGAYYTRVAITWDSVPQATGYIVYRGITSTTPLPLESSTSNSYSDTTATPGTTYYYWLKATNAIFTSAMGDYVTGSRAVYVPPPRTPANMRASDGTYSNRIAVSWSAVSNAYAYEILRSLINATGTAARVGGSVSATYNDYTAVVDKTYYYWVMAVNDGGTSRLSLSDSGVRAAIVAVPSAPQNVTASDGAYTNKVALTWTAVSNAASYKVYRSTNDTSTSAVWVCDATAPTAQDTSVTVGTVYYYWVQAFNPAGLGAFSASDAGYASATVNAPATPAGVAATKGAYSDRVRISWSAVSNASAYEVYRNTVNDSASASRLDPDTTSSPFDDSTVVVDTTYYYWVKAKNDAGTSGFSSGDSGYAVTTIVAPSAPSWLAATKGDYSDRVRVSWNAVSNATAYAVYRNTVNDSASAVKLDPDVTILPFDDTTVVADTSYYYWVKAMNSTGSSGFSSSDSGYAGWVEVLTVVGADYDGDRKADPAVYAESTGTWYIKISIMGYSLVTVTFGGAGYAPCIGDYDGDRRTDPAIYQANPSTGSGQAGTWQVQLSGSGYSVVSMSGFGGAEFQAVAGDYDGDGKADPAIYNSVNGTWQVAMSGASYSLAGVTGFGGAGYTAAEQNYDSDNRFDAAIYNTANGNWTVLLSASSYITATLLAFGGVDYVPLLGDFDGDGKADPTVYQESTGTWLVKLSGSGYATASLVGLGGANTSVTAADYDGDRKADPILLDKSTGIWRVKLSGSGYGEATLASGWAP